jgi:hypothetical protein
MHCHWPGTHADSDSAATACLTHRWHLHGQQGSPCVMRCLRMPTPHPSSDDAACVQIIPALERCLSLVGADVRAWFAAMPRPTRLLPHKRPPAALALPGAALTGRPLQAKPEGPAALPCRHGARG